jgi:predicted MPP superfamily phosphohydrolase
MAVYLIIALTIYALINFYVLRRAWQGAAGMGWVRSLVLGILLFLTLAYPVARFLERIIPGWLTESLDRLGSIYFVVMFYAFFILLLIDLLRLANHFFHFFPRAVREEPQHAVHITFLVSLATILFIIIGGAINAAFPRLRKLEIRIDKYSPGLQTVNIVMASDFHQGTVNRNARLRRIVRKINSLTPDLVVLVGDVMDMYVPRGEGEAMIHSLQEIRASLGVFSVTGNHEYYSGVKKNIDSLTRGGVRVLQDEAVKIKNSFYVVGRRDRSAPRWGERRASLKEILENVDTGLPLILLDHQPFHLEEAEAAGIDLQLSGHTHAGQLIPFNFINKAIYEQYWGYLRKGKSQYYVSCGVGTWGPPVRTGSRPEIIQIKLIFKSAE